MKAIMRMPPKGAITAAIGASIAVYNTPIPVAANPQASLKARPPGEIAGLTATFSRIFCYFLRQFFPLFRLLGIASSGKSSNMVSALTPQAPTLIDSF
jgi:hypothetical protein